MNSNVDHPSHYGGDTVYEVIKVLQAWLTPEEYIGFCKGNAITYQARHRAKGELEDLEKALWYGNAVVSYCRDNRIGAGTYIPMTVDEYEAHQNERRRLLAENNALRKRLSELDNTVTLDETELSLDDARAAE